MRLATLQAGHYTDVALIFDFDPQDNRFDPLLLKKLQSIYNESTELGQLYINYPMLESYCDFRYLGDYSFLDETVELGDVKGSAYKELVASKNQSMVNIKQLNGKTVAAILAMHISKIQYLIEGEFDKRAIVFESCRHVGSLCNQAYSCDLEKVLNYECGLLDERVKLQPSTPASSSSQLGKNIWMDAGETTATKTDRRVKLQSLFERPVE